MAFTARRVVPVGDVLLRQQVRGRDGDGPDPVQAEQAEPVLVAALEDEHHGVAAADAKREEEARGAHGHLRHLTEGEGGLRAFFIAPDQGPPVRLGARDLVHDVPGEIEALGHLDAVSLAEILVGGELGSFQESLQHAAFLSHRITARNLAGFPPSAFIP